MPVQAPTSLSNLTVDGVYVFIQPPAPQAGVGIPTNLAGIVGSASWGPLNQAVPFSDAASCYANFGPINSTQWNLMTEAYLAASFNNNFLGVRVSDGFDLAATAVIKDSGATNTGITVTAKYTGTVGNAISVQLAQGSLGVAYVTMTVNRTGYTPEVYPNITGTANALWVNLAAAINNGISGVRPKSALVTATAGAGTLGITAATTSLSGGSDGANTGQVTIAGTVGSGPTVTINAGSTSVTYTYVAGDTSATIAATDIVTALNANSGFKAAFVASSSGAVISIAPITTAAYTLTTSVTGGATATVNNAPGGLYSAAGSAPQIGADGTTGRTGMYTLRGSGVGQFILAGNTDTTVWGTQATFAASEGSLAIVANPSGTSSATAVTNKSTANLNSTYAMCLKDWVYFYDPVANAQRLVSPLGVALGLVASLPPEASPGNKPIGGIQAILSTERTGTPYSSAELGSLEQAGISLITNPMPRGAIFGLQNGQNSATTLPGQDTVAYTRMTNYLAYSLVQLLGPFVGELQSTNANDQTRNSARGVIQQFLNTLERQNRISTSSVTLNLSNNTATTIGQGYMIATVMVQYLAVVKFFVVNLQGGQTVQVQVGSGAVV